jgi:hypothetical protein
MPIINSDQDHTDLVKAGWITNTHGELKTILGDGVEPSYRRNYSNGLTALTWALPEEYGGRYSQLGYEACDYMCVTTSDHHLGGDIRFSISRHTTNNADFLTDHDAEFTYRCREDQRELVNEILIDISLDAYEGIRTLNTEPTYVYDTLDSDIRERLDNGEWAWDSATHGEDPNPWWNPNT